MTTVAVVLAGGLGTRMRPITEHKPKPLILFRGKPLICWVIEGLYSSVDQIFVTVKYLGDQFGDLPLSYRKVAIHRSSSPTMVGDFLEAVAEISGDTIVGISADVLFSAEILSHILQRFERRGLHALVALNKEPQNTYKKWLWDGDEEGFLRDVRVQDNPTGYEKYCLVIRRPIIEQFTRGFTANLGRDTREFQGYEKFQDGWVYLIKRLLESGVRIGLEMIEQPIRNVNTLEDLEVWSG